MRKLLPATTTTTISRIFPAQNLDFIRNKKKMKTPRWIPTRTKKCIQRRLQRSSSFGIPSSTHDISYPWQKSHNGNSFPWILSLVAWLCWRWTGKYSPVLGKLYIETVTMKFLQGGFSFFLCISDAGDSFLLKHKKIRKALPLFICTIAPRWCTFCQLPEAILI